MKEILVIGSTTADVIIALDHLPRTAEDVNVPGQRIALGGCACNAWWAARSLGAPAVLFSPAGSGVYGDFVRAELGKIGVESPIPPQSRENGCCYCFVEQGGERTFVSVRGAEYAFRREWFDALPAGRFAAAYLCGLEVEDPTGSVILDYLETQPGLQVYFAPGPRISHLPPQRLERIYNLHPILHLNESEAQAAAKGLGVPGAGVEQAAEAICRRTGRPVIVTLGGRGCYYTCGGERGYVPGCPAAVRDTIGAGDSHIGAVMALRQLGLAWPEALAAANRVSAAVVGVRGARLSAEEFAAVEEQLRREGFLPRAAGEGGRV